METRPRSSPPVERLCTAAALTGPISRGDSDTVALHLKAIGHMQEAAAAYRVLGRRSVALALRAGKIDDESGPFRSRENLNARPQNRI